MRPRDLPKARDQTARFLNDPGTDMHKMMANTPGINPDVLGATLLDAGLYWVTADMSALAIAAGVKLDAVGCSLVDRPSASGLILFDGGIGTFTVTDEIESEVAGCMWATVDDACQFWLFASRRRVIEIMASLRRSIAVEDLPPLVPYATYSLPAGLDPTPVEDIEPSYRTVVCALSASWLLMQQPTLVESGTERADKPVRRAYARAGRPDPEVTLIDLRRRYVPAEGDPALAGDGRRYRHRWVVSGHWKNQPYGPDHSLRRRQWQPSYVKGPDCAPLLSTERVNVWRR